MIVPTARAIAIVALGAPVAAALATFEPALGAFGAAWPLLMFALIGADAALAPGLAHGTIAVEAPGQIAATGESAAAFRFALPSARPLAFEAAIETGPLLAVAPATHKGLVSQGGAAFSARLKPKRRGLDGIAAVWVRWRGPLGLVWKSRRLAVAAPVRIIPDVDGAAREAERLFSRTLIYGLKPQRDRGDGAEFDSLVEFQRGMDRRSIDWKQSARHRKLLAKEHRVERNHNVVFAFDCGRLMSAPLGDSPRIDHALDAALLLGFVCLKLGDRVAAFAFDERPRVFTGLVSGVRGFDQFRRATAAIDYSTAETNFTLCLSELGGVLQRRAMIVVFTDFADTTSAELMIENLGRLMRRHLVVFVTMRDEELEAMRDAEPADADDVTRAVIAQSLLKERDAVVARLQRMGAHIVEARAAEIGPALVATYDHLRRREAR